MSRAFLGSGSLELNINMNYSTIKAIHGDFTGKDILSLTQFSLQDIQTVLKKADAMRKLADNNTPSDALKGFVVSLLFFEPSSRTFSSFCSAAQRLGAGTIEIRDPHNVSSIAKGETLEDTMHTLQSYSEAIIIRHPEVGAIMKAAEVSSVPVINAGEGVDEHPTQALLDIYTIKETFKRLENLHIIFFGELAHYRPVNSLAKALALFPKMKLSFVSPKEVKLNEKVRDYLQQKNVHFGEYNDIDTVIADADVLYVTRVKKEFIPASLYKKIQGLYAVDNKMANKMKKSSIIMHPLPRAGEIKEEVDSNPRAVYLRSQMRYGLYVRMALLGLVLGKL